MAAATVEKNPVRAIRMHCIDCSGGERAEVERCVFEGCPLFPFRLGHNPYRQQRQLTDQEKADLLARLRKPEGTL